jgi:hypothetical protein
VSELTATRVLVLPGADVRLARTGEPARVVGPCRHDGTGQEGVVVEGPLSGRYTYHTLEAFSRLFVPSDFVKVPGDTPGPPQQIRPESPAVPEKAAGHLSQGGGF